MEIIELMYWWSNNKLFGTESEWKKMYFSKESFINLLENKGEKGNRWVPEEDHYILEYSYGDKTRSVRVDEKSAHLLSKNLGVELEGG